MDTCTGGWECGLCESEGDAVDGLRCEGPVVLDAAVIARQTADALGQAFACRPTPVALWRWARREDNWQGCFVARCTGPTPYDAVAARMRAWSDHVRMVVANPDRAQLPIAGTC